MTDFLITFRPELAVLATALLFTALAFWLERGFRRRAERRAREQLPAEWRRALDETYGARRG
jgi:positive regulator of sigma E activity